MRLRGERLFLFSLLAGLMVVHSTGSYGQLRTDTTRTNMPFMGGTKDTTGSHVNAPSVSDSLAFAMRAHPFQPNPKKAGLYSGLVPGLGQMYNRQYWKLPIVYGGFAVAGYYIVKNLNDYQSYRLAYVSRINNPGHATDKYATIYPYVDQLQQLQDDSKKYLDLTILLTSVGYVLQVIDAVTSAHLKNFDISRDLSMRVNPVITPYGVGMGLVVNYK